MEISVTKRAKKITLEVENSDDDFDLVFRLKERMTIYVKNLQANETITLEVQKFDTIADIKAKIQDKEGISPNEQKLYFECMFLEDHRPLAHYNIKSEKTIQLLVRYDMLIFVRAQNDKCYKFVLQVESSTTIKDVKHMIQDNMGLWYKPEEQVLIYKNRSLRDGSSTLAECHISNESILEVRLKLRGG